MGGTEIKPVRSVQVAGEFMATSRQKTEVVQDRSGVEIIEPPTDALRPFQSVPPNKQILPVTDFGEPSPN